ncbi:F-type H+-transporting ATPase subunit b [Vigna unguiculata]|uniref:F-type H+-transporting ATPase subunit b n=1 Tax=Vigna unguiculata TaxID=3917 RepID=A0A4D6LY63_VIGUN|nr:F-type H+-transporting ATPase subunit b [Vigna unguiculata]
MDGAEGTPEVDRAKGDSDPKSLEDIFRKGFSTGVSYMYSSLFEVSQWCNAVDLLGKRRKITFLSCFGEISGSRGMERNILYLISKSSYGASSSNPGWVITRLRISFKNDLRNSQWERHAIEGLV